VRLWENRRGKLGEMEIALSVLLKFQRARREGATFLVSVAVHDGLTGALHDRRNEITSTRTVR
jgi:hypothetical protein